MPPALTPASLSLTAAGQAYAPAFDDVYHTTDGARGQAQHVFLAGNGLPLRWQGQSSFTILEVGFGLGLNLLTTWAAWQADPARCAHLHFISIAPPPTTSKTWPKFMQPGPNSRVRPTSCNAVGRSSLRVFTASTLTTAGSP